MSFEEDMERDLFTAEQEQALRQALLERAPETLVALELATTELEMFYALPAAASSAWLLGKTDVAVRLAEKMLGLAPAYRDDWNYGNAINAGHNVLGLWALHRGKTEEAVLHLYEAGRSPGSPQLNSFGPSMQLAKALAGQGEFQAVLTYLEQCGVFWKSGGVWLEIWKRKLLAKKVPNFFFGAYR